ncbi:hypothetical protein [Nocardia sp. NPDC051570]|uniref:hypothetical protein n=1 Tax=Nocardia sp. NPDC051570 TaxID=3364324 RepID=UPI00378DE726
MSAEIESPTDDSDRLIDETPLSANAEPYAELRGYEISEQQARDIAADAGPGWRVEREPNPPYGWNLVDDRATIVCSGSLDQIETWVLNRNTESSRRQQVNEDIEPT